MSNNNNIRQVAYTGHSNGLDHADIYLLIDGRFVHEVCPDIQHEVLNLGIKETQIVWGYNKNGGK